MEGEDWSTKPPGLYYGVHIPQESLIGSENEGFRIIVYEDKVEALKAVKKHKKARFKAFAYYHEAAEFAVHGSEPAANLENIFQKNDGKEPSVGEKPSQFRGPKSQDLVRLRKGIEGGDMNFVRTTIWENPRYLVSVGDTPSILQEGSRYNALHVAAKSKNQEMCELILTTIADVNFVRYLYGEDQHQDPVDRAKILLDLYLNTPDKASNESPLHFAVKFGAAKVVELLVSYPQCDKTLKNKYGMTPKEIICDRYDGKDVLTLKKEIELLLQDNYYVPVLRSEDNCLPPVIGEPFSPKSPPRLNENPLQPRLEIHAYAGPMNLMEAEKFRKVWKTPPRCQIFRTESNLAKKDHGKGLERVGRSLADKFSVAWKEYWPFLDSFIDICSNEGLEMLEKYLKDKLIIKTSISDDDTKGFGNYLSKIPIKDKELPSNCTKNDNNKTKISPTEAENMCHGLLRLNFKGKLNESKTQEIDIKVLESPMSELCRQMEAITLEDSLQEKRKSLELLDGLESCDFEVKSDFNPFLCVEKSCQVFAERFAKVIVNLFEENPEKNTKNNVILLGKQVKQLQLLITSYMDDCRFVSVDFHLIHARLGALVYLKLQKIFQNKQTTNCDDQKTESSCSNFEKLCKNIANWLETSGKNVDCFSSDDESQGAKNVSGVQKRATPKNKQVICVLQFILDNNNKICETTVDLCKTEDDCLKEWGKMKPCSCVFLSKSIRKSGSTKRNSFRYSIKNTSIGSEFSRKLSFDEEDDINNAMQNTNNDNTEKKDDDLMSDDEEFYTPPSSPSILEQEEIESSDEEEEFNESHLPEVDMFLEGDAPTKTDCDVYNALQKLANNKLNPYEYPNIYRWHHTISLYTEKERSSWTNNNASRLMPDSPCCYSTPKKMDNLSKSTAFTPPRSWLRITGPNSPIASLRSTPQFNATFNL